MSLLAALALACALVALLTTLAVVLWSHRRLARLSRRLEHRERHLAALERVVGLSGLSGLGAQVERGDGVKMRVLELGREQERVRRSEETQTSEVKVSTETATSSRQSNLASVPYASHTSSNDPSRQARRPPLAPSSSSYSYTAAGHSSSVDEGPIALADLARLEQGGESLDWSRYEPMSAEEPSSTGGGRGTQTEGESSNGTGRGTRTSRFTRSSASIPPADSPSQPHLAARLTPSGTSRSPFSLTPSRSPLYSSASDSDAYNSSGPGGGWTAVSRTGRRVLRRQSVREGRPPLRPVSQPTDSSTSAGTASGGGGGGLKRTLKSLKRRSRRPTLLDAESDPASALLKGLEQLEPPLPGTQSRPYSVKRVRGSFGVGEGEETDADDEGDGDGVGRWTSTKGERPRLPQKGDEGEKTLKPSPSRASLAISDSVAPRSPLRPPMVPRTSSAFRPSPLATTPLALSPSSGSDQTTPSSSPLLQREVLRRPSLPAQAAVLAATSRLAPPTPLALPPPTEMAFATPPPPATLYSSADLYSSTPRSPTLSPSPALLLQPDALPPSPPASPPATLKRAPPRRLRKPPRAPPPRSRPASPPAGPSRSPTTQTNWTVVAQQGSADAAPTPLPYSPGRATPLSRLSALDSSTSAPVSRTSTPAPARAPAHAPAMHSRSTSASGSVFHEHLTDSPPACATASALALASTGAGSELATPLAGPLAALADLLGGGPEEEELVRGAAGGVGGEAEMESLRGSTRGGLPWLMEGKAVDSSGSLVSGPKRGLGRAEVGAGRAEVGAAGEAWLKPTNPDPCTASSAALSLLSAPSLAASAVPSSAPSVYSQTNE
ncbi:hypothetical protein JCM10207_003999 [Rhodosporidiobolus poonsookiae]